MGMRIHRSIPAPVARATHSACIRRGGDPKSINKYGNSTPLHRAAARGGSVNVSKLLAAGADPGAEDGGDDVPLYFAAVKGEMSGVLKLLLAVSVDPRGRIKNSAVYTAAAYGNAEGLKVLLAAGAEPNQVGVGVGGDTPLHRAAACGRAEVVELLLAAGVDPNCKNDDGVAPLHIAALRGNVEVLQVLLAAAADPSSHDDDGYTPLHCAAGTKYGNVEVLQLLLDAGADPNARTLKGNTVLHCAVLDGSFERAEMLLRHGANVHIRDAAGRSTVDMARSLGDLLFLDRVEAAAAGTDGVAPGAD